MKFTSYKLKYIIFKLYIQNTFIMKRSTIIQAIKTIKTSQSIEIIETMKTVTTIKTNKTSETKKQ